MSESVARFGTTYQFGADNTLAEMAAVTKFMNPSGRERKPATKTGKVAKYLMMGGARHEAKEIEQQRAARRTPPPF